MTTGDYTKLLLQCSNMLTIIRTTCSSLITCQLEIRNLMQGLSWADCHPNRRKSVRRMSKSARCRVTCMQIL